jgi:thiol:disulfide interchange protein DsbD
MLLTAGAQTAGVAHIAGPVVTARAQATAIAALSITVEPGFHIQSNHPKLDYIIPSAITITPADGITATKVTWPPTVDRKFSFSPQPLAVFEGQIKVPVTLTTGAAGAHVLHGTFRYQACNDQLCRPPVTEPFTLAVHVR